MLNDYVSVIMSTRDPLQERTQKAILHLQRSTQPYELILLNRNRSWRTGEIINQGIHASVGDHIMFLCDDCFVEPTTLEEMKKVLQNKEVAIVGPVLTYPDGSPQSAGTSVCVVVEEGDGPPSVRIIFIADPITLQSIDANNMGYLTGACMMTRRDVIEDIGGYDPTCKLGGGDIDFCFRARGLGYRIVLAEDAHAVHISGATRGQMKSAGKDEVEGMGWFLSRWGNSEFVSKEVSGSRTFYCFGAVKTIDIRLEKLVGAQ